jgi:cytochrome c biogenesis protein CcmG/thiol:disulfide interchange protein DsbE
VRATAAAGVLVLAGVLAWHLTHQPKSVLKAVAQHRIVRAPGFTLPLLMHPGSLSLSSLRGKAVVVNFWQSDCVPCKQETQRLVAFSRREARRGVVVVGIDVAEFTKGPPRAFARRYGVPYALVYDPGGTTVEPWGVGQGTPQTFFVDRRGRIVGHVLGPVSNAALAAGARRALAT